MGGRGRRRSREQPYALTLRARSVSSGSGPFIRVVRRGARTVGSPQTGTTARGVHGQQRVLNRSRMVARRTRGVGAETTHRRFTEPRRIEPSDEFPPDKIPSTAGDHELDRGEYPTRRSYRSG